MKKLNQAGGLLLSAGFVVTIMLLFAAVGFGYWAYAERADYKDNVDQKVAVAVDAAKKDTAALKDTQFAEQEKLPLKLYQGPEAYGSVMIQYPKSWSAYVSEKGSGNEPLAGYFHPGFVPAVNNDTSYAIRLEVSSQSYASELKTYESDTKKGTVTVQAYKSAAAPNTVGVRIDGEVVSKKQGAMVMIPLRDKTLKVWTESQDYIADFNNFVLANLSFVP